MLEKIHNFMEFKMNYIEEDLNNIAEFIKNLESSTVLVTGATGLIGSLCVKAMQKNGKIPVIAMARNENKVKALYEETEGIKFLYQEITDPLPKDLRCDYIIHTANPTSSKYFISNPVEVIDCIYEGTKQILEFARINKIKGVVYLSSMEVFGVVNEARRVREDELGIIDIQNIRSCYSEGKRHAELLCKCYAEEYDVNVVIDRLAQTFGAGIPKTDNRVFKQFANSATKGEDIVLHTTGKSFGNYCYTRDALKAIFLILTKGKKGDVYTVVNEETTTTISQMASMVAERFSRGQSKVVFDIPENNLYGYAPETRLKLSSKKLRDLGWEPEIPLEEMYERMINNEK